MGITESSFKQSLHGFIVLFFVVASCYSCKAPTRDVAKVLQTRDSTAVDFIGEDYIAAFKRHVVANYSGKEIEGAVQEMPFLFYTEGRVFKMDIDTIIDYGDSLAAIRFHGALDSRIGFDCHVCYAPQALGVFVKRDEGYYLQEMVDVSAIFTYPWGRTSDVALHFEHTDWPGSMLFSRHTDGGQGNFVEFVHGIDLSVHSLGYERFRFSNEIRRESTFYPHSDDLTEAGFPNDKIHSPWQEAYKIMERNLSYHFDEQTGSFDIHRSTTTYWMILIGPEEEDVMEITESQEMDTLRYSIAGGIYAPL